MELGEICFHLKNRRRMYLLDDSFVTAVSFIEGFNAALDGEPLNGFRDWLNARSFEGRSGLHWAYIIASVRVPEVLEGGLRIDNISSDYNAPMIDDLLRLIGDFIAPTEGEGEG